MARKLSIKNLNLPHINLREVYNYAVLPVLAVAVIGVGYWQNRNLNYSRDAVLAELRNTHGIVTDTQKTVWQYGAAVTGTLGVMNQQFGQRFDAHVQDNISATQGISRTVAQGFRDTNRGLQNLEGRVGRVEQGITDTRRMITDTQGMVRQGDAAITYTLGVMDQRIGQRFDALEAAGREISGTVGAISNTLEVTLRDITYTILGVQQPVTTVAQLTTTRVVTPIGEMSYSVPYLEARPVVRANIDEIAGILAQGETKTRNPDGGLVWGRYDVAHIAGGLVSFYNGVNNDEEAGYFTIDDRNNTVAIELRTGRAINVRNIPETGIDRLRQIFGYN